ncbi:hypothetical protein SAMN05660909_01073 [Chitinophaga terrae (ex Kim and Jung 2007)]|uniref:DUF5673 domain-containing protein n=1 Tax=Chitinophaga terrae (ex Kim and Jung 2007) TaxID=408074 RepID=A0A1H3Z7Y6_9BACT|nr:hypothetical protein [Chitinophaga terrae (ex Kim and Jung 2007)]GEP88607.1 hypothetical protein CTE07_02520 [Chitinophaga terrae (ex Kim and Jung 2007)]SEA19494.1 hypothetical protein SAMN05660909_01073 [Chitinophaga terrae (ex Kim and Jung 2007)]
MDKLRILHPNTSSRIRLLPVMHGLTGILFLFNTIGVYRSGQPNWFLAALFFVMGLACIIFPFIMKRFKKFNEVNSIARVIEAFICFTSCLYFLSHKLPLTGLLLLLVGIGLAYVGWMEYKIFQPSFVRFDITGITLPTTFSTKLVGWNELNNVILRNDLLTIDYRNNRILQLEVLDEPTPAQREELNAFFQKRVKD